MARREGLLTDTAAQQASIMVRSTCLARLVLGAID
jgi:hypothetical protein